jgi:hypothetical protein
MTEKNSTSECYECGYDPKEDSAEDEDEKPKLQKCQLADCKTIGCDQGKCMRECCECRKIICSEHWWQCARCELYHCTVCNKAEGFELEHDMCDKCVSAYEWFGRERGVRGATSKSSESDDAQNSDSESSSLPSSTSPKQAVSFYRKMRKTCINANITSEERTKKILDLCVREWKEVQNDQIEERDKKKKKRKINK